MKRRMGVHGQHLYIARRTLGREPHLESPAALVYCATTHHTATNGDRLNMLTENPVLQAIRQRRSIRRYTDEAVSDEAVRLILEAGIWAPSGLNNQPCRFL